MVMPVLGPALLTGTMNLLGGAARNKAAKKEARRQEAFQERMSSTAHQREVKDLRAAGLNPILSATGGPGASSPGGASAPIQDIVGPAASSALAARRMTQEIQNLKAVELKTKADTILAGKQGEILSGPAGVGNWLGNLIDDFNRTVQSPVVGNLLRGGAKIRMDQFEDFLSSSAESAKRLQERIRNWIQQNTRLVPEHTQGVFERLQRSPPVGTAGERKRKERTF